MAKNSKHALTAYQQGNLKEALSLYKKQCKQNPSNVDAWLMTGVIEGKLGALSRAEKAFRTALKLQPGSFSAWDNLAIIKTIKGQYRDAEQHFRRSLQLNPNNHQAHNGLGNTLRELGKPDAAAAAFRKAIALKHDYVEAYNNLGNLLQDQCSFADAARMYKKAIVLSPNYIDALFNLGTNHQKSGQLDEALKLYYQVLQLTPTHFTALAAIADIYEKQGHYQEAYNQLNPLVIKNALPVSSAGTFGTICRRLNRHTEAIHRLEHYLEQTAISPKQAQDLHFCLGELYDDIGRVDNAFQHFVHGNALRPFPNDEVQQRQTFQSIRENFNKENLAKLPQSSNKSELPVFIVGMPRSGTSLIEQILASHPDIHGGGELSMIADITKSLPEQFGKHCDYPDGFSSLTGENLDRLADTYLDYLSRLSLGVARVTDKMPHNFLHLGLIDRLFPNARVIHCVRDPMDTLLSIYFHNFNANHPYANNLDSLGKYYGHYQAIMNHWKDSLRIPILDVQYENLVMDQEQESRRLIEFCGLPWNDVCLRYHETKRVVSTPSYDQVRKPVYRSSIGRWRAYEKYLAPLKNALNTDASLTD